MKPDVVVVGAGALGAAVTWRLASASLDVCWVVGAGSAGSASAAAGAMLAVYSEVSEHDDGGVRDLEVASRRQGRDRWDEWLVDVRQASGAALPLSAGIYVIGRGARDSAGVATIRAAAAASGGAALTVAANEVPGLQPDRGAEATDVVFLPDEASLDGAALLAAMHVANRTLPNVTVVSDRAVRITAPGQVLIGSGETVVAGDVVLAGGVETPDLLQESGLGDALPPVFGGRGVALVVRAPEPARVCLRSPNRAFACGLHAVPRADGLTYLGATNRLATRPELGAGPQLSELDDLIGGCVRELDTRLRRAELVSSAVGYRPVTLDRLPLVGRTTSPGLLVATGTWRNGIVLAPLVADLIADELAEAGSTSKHPFAPTRPMAVTELDDAALTRAAEGIVTALVADAALAPGRAADLTTFLKIALEREIDPTTRGDRAVARLLERAPIEEVFPLVFDLLVRARR